MQPRESVKEKGAVNGRMNSENKKHFVYIILSEDGRYYTGYTTDLERRLKEHRSGLGGKFTRSFGAEKILYSETFSTRSDALKREAELKSWPRAKKKALINGLLS